MELTRQRHALLLEERHPGFRLVYHSLNGSRLYGTHRDSSDYDYIGAALETTSYCLGLQSFDQTMFKNVDHNEEGTIYSLRKFLFLLQSANPSLLVPLFNPAAFDPFHLQDIRDAFLSQRAFDSFIGYSVAQMKRIKTSTGMHVTRKDLIDEYGYDTKYAAHIHRLVSQGSQYVTSGVIQIPMTKEDVEAWNFIYYGGFKEFSDFEAYATSIIEKLRALEKTIVLPEKADLDTINDWYTSVISSVHFSRDFELL